ncbi:hypothetical protein Tco_0756764 [Tanacetum coccineum]
MAKSRLSQSPPRSPRNDLSLDKTITLELTAYVLLTPTTSSQDRRKSKLISKRHSHIPGALHRICRRQGFMIKQMEKKYVINLEFQGIKERVDDVLHDIVPKIASNATNDQIEDNLPRIVADADAWVEDTIIDEDEVILEDETPELIEEFHNVDKRVPTIFDHERIEATLRDMMSNQFKDAEEYAYHVKDN